MHFQLHRYIRKIFIQEIQNFLNQHPFYGSFNKEFQSAPVKVMEIFNFEGRHYPVVLISSSNIDEQRLSMDRLIIEEYGHVRPTYLLTFFTMKIDDDPSYEGEYIDAKYLLEVVNADNVEEDIRLKITQIEPEQSESKFFEIPEDGILLNAIPGARIIIGSFNDRIVGQKVEVETFKEKRYLGNIYGSRFSVDVSVVVYAQTQNEITELLDLISMFGIYFLPQRLYYKHYINLIKLNSSGISKEGNVGEEYFKGEIRFDLSVEANVFVPYEIVEKYGEFRIAIRKDLNKATSEDIIHKIAEF